MLQIGNLLHKTGLFRFHMHSTVFKDYSQKKCSLESKIFGAVQVTWSGTATLFKLHKTDLISDLADLYRFLMINAHAICMDKIFGTTFFLSGTKLIWHGTKYVLSVQMA